MAAVLSVHRVRDKIFPYLLLLPAFAIAGIVLLYPLINGIRMSFTGYSLLSPQYNWIGVQNYLQLSKDPVYWEIVTNSFVIVLPSVALQLLFGLAMALLLNVDFPFRGVFRSAVFIIWVIPEMVVALLWMVMYNKDDRFLATKKYAI